VKKVDISEVRANCSKLLIRVHDTRKPLRVTRFGKALVDLVPVSPRGHSVDWIGSMRSTMRITGEILSPANDRTDWEAERG